jgi:pyruvate kinase
MATRTKIICTIGPAVDSLEKILDLIDAGMNVARLNFSHGTHESHRQTIEKLKKAREMAGCPLAIMLDTKGPEIRVAEVPGDGFEVSPGMEFLLARPGTQNAVCIDPPSVLHCLEKNNYVLFADGYISARVKELTSQGAILIAENHGIIERRNGVNIPDRPLNLPPLTEQDIADLKFGCEQGVDIVAASFVRSADHVIMMKKLLSDLGQPKILIVAKIENHEGVNNFDSILHVADGIMIARGDLGVEVPLSQVPRLQKMMIRKCYLAGKPSVTATQMLESMIKNPRPTRAEASDVANAIYDSTSVVMLSGETAKGKYPIEAVRVMKKIIEEAEADFDYAAFFQQHSQLLYHDVPSAVTLAAVKTAYSCHARAIIAFTSSGSTARMLSRLRPSIPIIALTPHEKDYHQLAFNWGVVPTFCAESKTIEEGFKKASELAMKQGYLKDGDLVVLTAGTPFGIAGTTNMLVVENIGDVLVRGYQGNGTQVYGKIKIIHSPEEVKPFSVKDRILLMTECHDGFLQHLKAARGVILQNHMDDIESERYLMLIAKTLGLSIIIRADNAKKTLADGQLVTLDPDQAIVFKGIRAM